jgi:hypothetical protein
MDVSLHLVLFLFLLTEFREFMCAFVNWLPKSYSCSETAKLG